MIFGINVCDGVINVTTDQDIVAVMPGVHPNYNKILELVKESDLEGIEPLLDVKSKIEEFSQAGTGELKVRGNNVYFGDRQLHGVIVDQVFKMLDEGHNVGPLENFLTNLFLNPSKTVVDELYDYMMSSPKDGFTLTPDGHFLAYKRVRNDYKDCHSGTIDNSVGEAPEVPRNKVDDNRNNTCSYGLHFCSLEYLRSFHGDRCMILKINPADVVSIPTDYQHSKGRTCRYEVVGELSETAFQEALRNNKGIFENAVDDSYEPTVEDTETADNDGDWYSYEKAAVHLSCREGTDVSVNAVRKRTSRGRYPKRVGLSGAIEIQI